MLDGPQHPLATAYHALRTMSPCVSEENVSAVEAALIVTPAPLVTDELVLTV